MAGGCPCRPGRARRCDGTNGAGVRAVDHATDGWVVSLDEETLQADVLMVAAGGPDAVAKLLGDRSPRRPGPAAELSVLDLGLASLPRGGRRFALGIDAPTYLSRHSPPTIVGVSC